MKIFESTKIPLLSKALTAYALRQKVTSSNIANVNTAGYRAQAVTFEDQMQTASQIPMTGLATTNEMHLKTGAPDADGAGAKTVDAAAAGIIPNDPYASGVNDVDIDHEMSELAENQLRFKYAARMMTETFRTLQKSIRGQQ